MKDNQEKGFTLLEMAVSLLILGLLLAPAISAYNIYEQTRKIEETDNALNRTSLALEGFFSAYGRYPCPSPVDAISGDNDYGFESRDPATGDCLHDASATPVAGVFSSTSEEASETTPRLPAGDDLVVIGSVPFKTLNLQEDEVYDGYGFKLTYAVTDILADPDDYSPNLGGISINKFDDVGSSEVSAIVPDHSAHYIVFSHGIENTGGFTGDGVRRGLCANALSEEQENCDDDSVFFISERNVNFDDIVLFGGGSPASPWQYQDNVTSNIHLKLGGENVISGAVANVAEQDFTPTLPIETISAFEIRNSGYTDQLLADCGSTPFTTVCLDRVALTPVFGDSTTPRSRCEANLSATECTTYYNPFTLTDFDELADLQVRVVAETDLSGAAVPDTGGVLVREICEGLNTGVAVTDPTFMDGINCFDPLNIGGADTGDPTTAAFVTGGPFPNTSYARGTPAIMLATTDPRHPTGADTPSAAGGNFKCPTGEVMVGLREGQIICSQIAEFDCPAGQTLTGINGSGELVCDTAPLDPCPALDGASNNIRNTCGEFVDLPLSPAGGHIMDFYGRCYIMDTFDATTADGFTTQVDLQNYIDGLNNAVRTLQDCNLVRDRFECANTAWDTVPRRSREKNNYSGFAAGFFPTGGFGSATANTNSETEFRRDGSGNLVADGDYQEYVPATPMSVFPSNNNPHHDCWCREDYRVQTAPCPSGSGIELIVEKKSCPQTNTNGWQQIWSSGSALCACTLGDTRTTAGRTCAEAIGVPNNRVNGNVVDTYTVTGCAPFAETLTGTDYAGCSCPSYADEVPRNQTDCPVGFTNSFSFDGANYTDKSSVTHRRWSCPHTPTLVDPIDTPAEVAQRTDLTTNETCNCVGGIMDSRIEACPANLSGVREFETILDCGLAPPGYADTGTLLSDCQVCRWKEPSAGSPLFSAGNPGGDFLGDTCHCTNDSVSRCKVNTGSGFDFWNDCRCE